MAPSRVTLDPSAALTVSNAKSPVSVWPKTSSVTPVPPTCTNGPAGSFRSMGEPSMVTDSSTATPVVFTAKANAPPKSTPGRSTSTDALTSPANPELVSRKAPCPSVTLTRSLEPSPSVNDTLLAPTRIANPPSAAVVCSNAKSPRRLWPSSEISRSIAWKPATLSAVSKRTTTSSSAPPIGRMRSMARPVLLKRTIAVPITVTPSIPTICTVPRALSANLPFIRIRPIVASVSSTPVASGLICPLPRRAGPRPRNISSSLPAKTLSVSLPAKLTLPSTVTKSPMFSDRSDTEIAKTFRSRELSPKPISMVRPASVIVSSMGRPVVLTRRVTVPPAETGPTSADATPETMPATPSGVITNPPCPSAIPFPATSTLKSVTASLVIFRPSDSVRWSNVKLPCATKASPPTLNVTSTSSSTTRTNGPAARSRITGSPSPKSNVLRTSTGMVFSSMLSVKSPAITLATLKVASAVNSPATPWAPITKAPNPSATVTNGSDGSPSCRLTSVAPTFTNVPPSTPVSRTTSNRKTPESV